MKCRISWRRKAQEVGPEQLRVEKSCTVKKSLAQPIGRPAGRGDSIFEPAWRHLCWAGGGLVGQGVGSSPPTNLSGHPGPYEAWTGPPPATARYSPAAREDSAGWAAGSWPGRPLSWPRAVGEGQAWVVEVGPGLAVVVEVGPGLAWAARLLAASAEPPAAPPAGPPVWVGPPKLAVQQDRRPGQRWRWVHGRPSRAGLMSDVARRVVCGPLNRGITGSGG
jgi:hypothetical protein